MMKRFIRRMTAFALSAMLLTAPMAQAQELTTPEGAWLSVEIVVTLEDGSQVSLFVTPVTTTLGSTVYWLDDTLLSDEERAALSGAQLRLVTDAGEVYSEMPLSGTGLDSVLDYPVSVVNPIDPSSALTFMRADYSAPATEEEADTVLSPFGFETPAPVEPVEPIEPEQPVEPVEPVEPEQPVEPIQPEPTAEPEVELPPYATVNQPETAFYFSANEWDVKGSLNPSDVLFVNDYTFDDMGRLWYMVEDYRSTEQGWVIAEQATGLDDDTAQILMAQIDAETAAPEETPIPTEEPVIEETPIPTEEPVIEETPIPTEEPVIEETPVPTEEPVIEETPIPTEEPVIEETPIPTEEPVQPTTQYAVTYNSRGGNGNNLRSQMDSSASSVLGEYPDGVLLRINEVVDNSWYNVTVVRDGMTGYMRDFLVSQIADADAERLLAELEATQEPTQQPAEETPVPTEQPAEEPTQQPIEETSAPTEQPVSEVTEAPGEITFPAYAITVEKDTFIILRSAPDAPNPTSGAIPTISRPTPLEISAQEIGENGQLWYLVRNMSNGDTGYVESYNVRLVSQQEAEAAVQTPQPTIPPIETPTPEPTAEPTPEPTPEPVPQELTEGDVYHYGYNTGKQVRLRDKPNGDTVVAKLSAGTILWVMQREGDWCYVRTDSNTGYMMAEYVKLMGVEEEAAYIASIDDPETRPDPTQIPTPIPTDTPVPTEVPTPEPTAEPTPEPTATPEVTPEITATPVPTEVPTAEPTETPAPTATPAPVQLSLYARVINDGTPLRGNPSAQAYLQNILYKETVVYIFQSQFAEDGMMWYLVQYNGQWGYVRADLVRVMGEQETSDYLGMLEAAQATPTPMPQATPEPMGPDATSAYAKLIRDSVNLRRTPSASGTSLGRIPVNTLLLVTGTEYDGTYTWYQVNYNGMDGYVRSDMAQMLTIAELQQFLVDQAAQATPTPRANTGVSTTPNKNNNTNITINGTPLQDLLPTDNSWSSGTGTSMPTYATSTPDPNSTPTPEPVANPAALISSYGNLKVNNVPAKSETGKFTVYGTTSASSIVTASVEIQIASTAQPTATPQQLGFVASAVAESVQQTVRRTVGQAVADSSGNYTMEVTLPQPGEYIVEFASGTSYANYGVTYDTGMTPEPTAQPMPTAEPVQEEGGMGILPIVIVVVLAVVAGAAIYGVYIYRRKSEEAEEEEADEDEDEEDDIRAEQLNQQRSRYAQPQTPTGAPKPQAPSGQVPSYMRSSQPNVRSTVNPYAPKTPSEPVTPSEPIAPKAPTAPVAPTRPMMPTETVAPIKPTIPTSPVTPSEPIAPKAPTAPVAPTRPMMPTETVAPIKPTIPTSPVAPSEPIAPKAPTAPIAPAKPVMPTEPAAPTTSEETADHMESESSAPRRRRRPPVDPNA